jgi:hypothetical protein
MTPGFEIVSSAPHSKPTLNDAFSKLDRQQGFGESPVLDRGACFPIRSDARDGLQLQPAAYCIVLKHHLIRGFDRRIWPSRGQPLISQLLAQPMMAISPR